jgi:hypothetical protein
LQAESEGYLDKAISVPSLRYGLAGPYRMAKQTSAAPRAGSKDTINDPFRLYSGFVHAIVTIRNNS